MLKKEWAMKLTSRKFWNFWNYLIPPPPQFFEDSKNTAARSAAGFSPTLPPIFLAIFCENFDPKPCEVRSPGQVKWPNYKITFQSRHGHNVSGKVMKLSEYDEVISASKTYMSDFWYRWSQVSSFLRPPHYKSMGKKSTPLYLIWRKPIWVESYRIGQLRTIRVKICIAYPSKGHLRTPEVTNRHLPIIFDKKEIETWDWCQYVRLGQANRLICNMTHFGHHVTLAWLDMKSNFDLDLAKSFYIWFDAFQRDKHDGIKVVALPLKLKILSSKNRFGIFLNLDPWRPQFWPETKNQQNDFEMIFCELSNAVFRFSLRRPGAEIMGGVRTPPPPPPSRRWKIQRPSRVRVNIFFTLQKISNFKILKTRQYVLKRSAKNLCWLF